MTARPILFSDSMIRALLDGRKTQTRRVLMGFHSDYFVRMEGSHAIFNDHILELATGKPHLWSFPGRYGVPGDRLWVRETWNTVENDKGADCVQYRANIPESDWKLYGPWRPSIFMPRWASRITLEIVSVGVERVDQISDADTIAEGIVVRPEWTNGTESRRAEYGLLWDRLNAKRGFSFEKSPWVWKIEFRRI